MQLSLDISLYPLTPSYKKDVTDFIALLHHNKEITIKTNSMSTQVFGEFDQVMGTVSAAIKMVFQNGLPASVVMKMFPSELNPE